jgi:AcrR family transcriptional regulator
VLHVEVTKRKWTRSPEREAAYEAERKAIIRAAYQLIGRDTGFVSVQEILDSAGLSTRAFYRHFATKDDLMLYMYRQDNERVSKALWAATEGQPDHWDALRAWIDVSLSVVYDSGPELHSRVLGSAELRSAEGWDQEHLDGVDRSMGSLRALLQSGAEDGTFPGADPEIDSHMIFGALSHLTSLRMRDGSLALSRERARDSVLDSARRMLVGGHWSSALSP